MRSTVGAASFASLRQFTFCLHRPALCRAGAPSMGTLFVSVFLSCLRRAPVMVPSSRQSRCGPDFPRLNNPPLETAKKGELRFPLLGTSPRLFSWWSSGGGGLLRNAPAARGDGGRRTGEQNADCQANADLQAPRTALHAIGRPAHQPLESKRPSSPEGQPRPGPPEARQRLSRPPPRHRARVATTFI